MKTLKWILYAGMILFFTSCGYQLEGGGYVDTGVRLVAVRALENKTSETGATVAFTNAIIREILQRTDTRVVDESLATAFVEGTIKKISFAALTRASTESVLERRIVATIDLKLINRDGDVIWSASDLTSYEDYTVSTDNITDEENKRAGMEKIALRSAEKLINRLMNNF